MRPAAPIATALPLPDRSRVRTAAAIVALTAALLALFARSAAAQLPDRIERRGGGMGYVNLTGPRVGVLFLEDQDRLRDSYDIDRTVTQLGFALERRMFAVPSGPMGVVQLTALAGVSDRFGDNDDETKWFVPSGMLLVGLRTQSGCEVAFGGWAAERDVAPMLQVGAVLPAGYMRLPLHVQLVPMRNALRIGVLTGFNISR